MQNDDRLSWLRRSLFSLLPKVALSRTTGVVTRIPLPRALRAPAFRAFARRYGAALDELDAPLDSFRSLAAFFQRPLRAGARPVADAPLVDACDGRIVSSGPIDAGRIEQIKGVDYTVAELLGDAASAAALHDGSQSTVYLAPGDYHRVHAPFDATITAIRALPGTLFPVNQAAVRSFPRLFVRNARVVFEARLDDGRTGAVVMVGALNVGLIHRSVAVGTRVRRGDEVGRFGFGSTAVSLVARGSSAFWARTPGTVVRMGGAAAAQAGAGQ